MSKRKKLIVVSSVLTTCMLFSISALALSNQEEITGVGDSSEVALSEGNAVQSDTLEQVVSEKVSEKQVTKVQQIFVLSTVDTCEKVEKVLGEPCSTRGSYNLTDEWPAITKTYKTNSGEKVKVYYHYDFKTDTESIDSIKLPDGAYIVPGFDTIPEYKDYSFRTDLTTEMFEQFVEKKTTAEEVRSIVGIPHAFAGSGLIKEVYYTTDGNRVSIYYAGGIASGVIDTIYVYKL